MRSFCPWQRQRHARDRSGAEVVDPCGRVTSITLSGGEQDVYGTTTATTIDSGGVEDVESAGVASGTTIDSGGVELIALGGVTMTPRSAVAASNT